MAGQWREKMAISKELEAQILRYFHVEKWRAAPTHEVFSHPKNSKSSFDLAKSG
jgi:hypothetical protein